MSRLSPISLQTALDSSLFEAIERDQPELPTLNIWNEAALIEASKGRQLPVLLKGCGKSWRAQRRWDFSYFHDVLGHVPVQTHLYSGGTATNTTLRALVEQVLNARSKPVYLQEWWYELDAPELVDDFDIPECFQQDFSLQALGYRNSHLWIGSAGAFTPIHQDETHSDFWSYQVVGVKRWLLVHPDALIPQKHEGGIDIERWRQDWGQVTWSLRMQPGDVLYVPERWWHSAQGLDPNVTLRNVHVWPNQSQRYFRDILSLPMKLALRGEELRSENRMLLEQLQTLCTKMHALLSRDLR